MKKIIIPAIIANSQKELDERFSKVKKLSGVFHLDVMDGKFVKNKSLLFDFKLPREKKYVAHLMMNGHGAMLWIRKNKKKVDLIFIHYKTKNFKSLLGHLKKQKIKFGIAINPKTRINEIKENLGSTNHILVMTVNPGRYGARFLPKELNKIKQLKKLKKGLNVMVDGGINDKTISLTKKAGANMFVVGSFLQKSENPGKTFKNLKKLI